MTLVRVTHARRLGYCNKGVREFCKRHGIDFYRFRHEGIPTNELEHIDDSMLQAVIKEAKNHVE